MTSLSDSFHNIKISCFDPVFSGIYSLCNRQDRSTLTLKPNATSVGLRCVDVDGSTGSRLVTHCYSCHAAVK